MSNEPMIEMPYKRYEERLALAAQDGWQAAIEAAAQPNGQLLQRWYELMKANAPDHFEGGHDIPGKAFSYTAPYTFEMFSNSPMAKFALEAIRSLRPSPAPFQHKAGCPKLLGYGACDCGPSPAPQEPKI